MNKLEWALKFQGMGMSVFPIYGTDIEGNCNCGNPKCLSAGKHPNGILVPNGVIEATADPLKVMEWFGEENCPHNIGVTPGKNFAVIDLDLDMAKGKDGKFSLSAYLDGDPFKTLGDTFTVETPRGGYHLYFSTEHPVSNKVGVLEGVDIRGYHGYVLAPGSSIGLKEYTCLSDVPPIKINDAILPLFKKVMMREVHDYGIELDNPSALSRARDFLKRRAPAIEGQGGNYHTYVTVCHLRDLGLSDDTARDMILESEWNQNCSPPWDAHELTVLINNAYKYAKADAGVKGTGLDEKTFAAAFGADLVDADTKEYIKSVERGETGSYSRHKSKLYNFHDAVRLDRQYDFLISKWVPAVGYTALLAPRGIGKTTVLIDLGLCVATDQDWHSAKVDKGWTVCYIMGEDPEGVLDRMRAWKIDRMEGEDIPDPNRFLVYDAAIDFCNTEEVSEFTKFLKKETQGINNVMFVLDTWQRMIQSASGGQNDEENMQKAVANMEAMARSFKGPTIVAFHPPKNNKDTITGSAVLENASHSIIHISDHSVYKTVEVKRLKGAAIGEKIDFKFKTVKLGGVDKFGDDRTGPVFDLLKAGELKTEQMKEQELKLARFVAEVITHIKEFDDKLSFKLSLTQIFESVFFRLEEKAVEGNRKAIEWLPIARDLGISTALTHSRTNRDPLYDTLRVMFTDGGVSLRNGRRQRVVMSSNGKRNYLEIIEVDSETNIEGVYEDEFNYAQDDISFSEN